MCHEYIIRPGFLLGSNEDRQMKLLTQALNHSWSILAKPACRQGQLGISPVPRLKSSGNHKLATGYFYTFIQKLRDHGY